MATWKDLDKEQENAESHEEEEIVANLCFMADIISEEETEVSDFELNITYENLQKAYDELLDNSQLLASHYTSLKKNFQKLSLECEKLKGENKKLGQRNTELLDENSLLQKDVIILKTEVFKMNQNTSSNVSKLQNLVKLLKSDLGKMVNGSKNLDLMLGGQKQYLDKTGLGYVEEVNEESSKHSQHKIPACIYCFKMGHSFEKYLSRRKAKQKVKKPKKLTNIKGPKKIWVLKAKLLLMQECFKSQHQKEKVVYG